MTTTHCKRGHERGLGSTYTSGRVSQCNECRRIVRAQRKPENRKYESREHQLTAAQVRRLRDALADGVPARWLAKRFGLAHETVAKFREATC